MQVESIVKSHIPIIGVMGSGTEPYTERSTLVGEWLAGEGMHLLTGGGSGVMEAVSKAFYTVPDRKGLVIGILPGMEKQDGYESLPGYPNPWVELPIYTHLPLSGPKGVDPMSRNHINILSSSVIIALPGSHGTASEIILAQKYNKPLVAFLDNRDEIPGLPRKVTVEKNFDKVKTFIKKHL